MKTTAYRADCDLAPKIRRAMCDLLNRQLADILDLGLQAKQAHWNVKGPHFIGLHELFDKAAEELESFADDIAERAVALGGIARGTAQVVAAGSRLPAYPLDLVSGKDHVARLASALGHFGTTTREAIERAARTGDADTADLFTEASRGVDKLRWMIKAHLEAND